MTRLEIRTMARKRLGEVSGVFWEDTELNTWFTAACDDIAFKTKSIKTNGYFTSAEDTADYSLATFFPNLLSVLEVYFLIDGDVWKKLDPITSRTEFDIRFPGWMNVESGTPNYYYYSREEDNLQLFPQPNDTNAGADYARVYYARTCPAVANDTVAPQLPDNLHLAIVDWIVSLGYETRGYGDKANDAMSKYEARLQKYLSITSQEKEDDEIIMKSYRRHR